MTRPPRTPLHLRLAPGLLALLPLTTGCVLLAGAGVGYVVSREVRPGAVQEAEVADDVDRVWPSSKETAEILHDSGTQVRVQDSPRRIQLEVDGAKVVIEVEAVDLDRTLVRVSAQKYLGADSKTAEEVMGNVLRRLQKK
ncbi:MAG TPA: hypothetical protein ENJ09_12220 [Planctomycetes bacterium]|nr:hypothetical protein [Planctomycetota bacterium]